MDSIVTLTHVLLLFRHDHLGFINDVQITDPNFAFLTCLGFPSF